MSKFTQQEETMIVKNAMELTATIMVEEIELRNIKSEKFRDLPNPPKRTILRKPEKIYPQYPPKPTTTYSYTEYLKETVGKFKNLRVIGIAAIIIFLSGIIIPGLFFVTFLLLALFPVLIIFLIITYHSYSTKRQALNRQLSESQEYLQAVENAEKLAEKQQKEAEAEFQQQQKKLDAEYEEEKNQYENVTVPKYNEDFNTWTVIQERKIAFLDEELKCNKEVLNSLYDATKIISKTYREFTILKWLYEDMSTSDHDIRYATEILDRDRQRAITAEAGKRTQTAIYDMKQAMMIGFNAVYNAIEYGNDLQEDSIEILSKTRRDINIGNMIGTVQRHNTNKMLDSLLPKK